MEIRRQTVTNVGLEGRRMTQQTTALAERKQQEEAALQKAIQQVALLDNDTKQALALGRIFAMSGMFPTIKSGAQAVVKILAGRELGFSPIYSMMHVHMIEAGGRTNIYVSTEAYGARMTKAGINYTIMEQDDRHCVIYFERGTRTYTSEYTIERAKKAGLIKAGGAWEKHPENMLYWRALRNGARVIAPDIMAAMEVLDEATEAEIVEHGGNVIQEVAAPHCERHPDMPMRQAKTGHWYCPMVINGKYCGGKKLEDPEATDITDYTEGEITDEEYLPEPASAEQIAQDEADLFGPEPEKPSPVQASATPAPQEQATGANPYESLAAEMNKVFEFDCGPLFKAISNYIKADVTSWADVETKNVPPSKVREIAQKVKVMLL